MLAWAGAGASSSGRSGGGGGTTTAVDSKPAVNRSTRRAGTPLPLTRLVSVELRKNFVVATVRLDLFGGSGSTLIAAEQTGRKAFLMELDPPYCDVIVQRFEKFTGQKAERQTLSHVA